MGERGREAGRGEREREGGGWTDGGGGGACEMREWKAREGSSCTKREREREGG